MGYLKRILSLCLRISISLALLIFLFKQVDNKNLFDIIKKANIPFLSLAFCILGLGYILSLFRWEMLLRALKMHLSLKRVIMSFAGGIFFSLFLPSTIGGDLMRSVDLATHTKRPREVIATVLLDRLSGYIGLVILALVSLVFGWKFIQDKSVLLFVIIITAILIAVLLVLFNKTLYSRINRILHNPNAGKIREMIKNLHEEIHYFKRHKNVIAQNLFFSILIQAVSPLAFFVIALSLGIKINIIYFFVFLPIISAITLLPISIGGLGLRDATTIFFFAKVGIGRDLAFAMSLLNFFFLLLFGILGGLIYVFTIPNRRIQHRQTPFIHPQR